MVNKLACAGFEDMSEFYKIKEAMIAREYNVEHKAILKSVRDTEQRKTILKLLNSNEIDKALLHIAKLSNDTEDETS